MWQLAVAGVMALALSGCVNRPVPAGQIAEATDRAPTPWLIDPNIIPRISCVGLKGGMIGTGIVIDSDRVLTARHVVEEGYCNADGIPFDRISGLEGAIDFVDVKLSMDVPMPFRALVSCEGFKEGDLYLATGYALGGARAVTQMVIGSKSKDGGRRTYLRGSFTPGMSGGPVSDMRGRIVGIVNAYSEKGVTLAYSIALKDTHVCRGGA